MALRSITGKVEDIVFKLSGNGNEFCTISFIEKKNDGSWNKYPYNCRTFDEEIVEALKEEVSESESGLTGVSGVLRVDVKQDREYQGKTVTDRDIVDFNFTGKIMEWTRTWDMKDEVQPPPPSAGATYTGGGDARQASIERQVAYKEAVALTMARRGMPIVSDKFLDGSFSGEKYAEKYAEKLAPNWEQVAGFREWWNAVNRATDIGESILNRTYINSPATASDDNADVKEPDDEQDQKERF